MQATVDNNTKNKIKADHPPKCDTNHKNEKVRLVRPTSVYILTHSYTCSHLYGNEQTTDQVGVYYSEKNALKAAADFIEDEFDHVKITDKGTFFQNFGKENDDNENGKKDGAGTTDDEEDDDEEDDEDSERITMEEFYETGEFETEVETEGSDTHIVRYECLTVADA